MKKKSKAEQDIGEQYITHRKCNQRPCTTCGKPTRDYRCNACWRKLRGFALHEVPQDARGIDI